MAYLNRNPSDVRPCRVRIGLIGSGWMGAFHAESIARRVPGAVLAAIADPNLESAEALAGALGTAKVTADAADILADPEIDAVVIASPARFHSALIGQAAAAGKHVFCEKPAGLGLEELDAALAAVDAAGVHFQIGFNRRYAADFQAAKKDLAAGIVGAAATPAFADPGPGHREHRPRREDPGMDHLPRNPDPRLRHPQLVQRRRRARGGLRRCRRARGAGTAGPGLPGHGRGDHPLQQRRDRRRRGKLQRPLRLRHPRGGLRLQAAWSRPAAPPKPPPAGSPPRGCPPTPHG